MVQNESEKDADHNFSGQLLLAAGSLLLDFFHLLEPILAHRIER